MTLQTTRLSRAWHHAHMTRPTLSLVPNGLTRRQLLCAAAGLGLGGAQAAPSKEAATFTRLLREGGCAVLIRHAQTEPGTGDPPGFRLDECGTQRQLSLEGIEQSRRLGQWFAKRKLTPGEVLSSQWCRCRHTADFAFGRSTEWPALNSTFGDSSRQPAQTTQLRARLKTIGARQFEVWVTHQVNMTDLTDQYPSMGEAFLVDGSGRLRGRFTFV